MKLSIKSVIKEYPKRRSSLGLFMGSFRKETLRAIDNITLNIFPGSRIGIYGPNGSGKTTLLEMVAGISMPTSGTIAFGKQDLTNLNSPIRKRIRLIDSDTRNMYARLSIRENMLFSAALYGIKKDEAQHRIGVLCRAFGISDMHARYDTLSEGFKQRVKLANGLLSNPKLLLIDELGENLDVQSLQQVLSFIKEHSDKNHAAVLFTSQNLDILNRLAQSIVMINKGKIAYELKTTKAKLDLNLIMGVYQNE